MQTQSAIQQSNGHKMKSINGNARFGNLARANNAFESRPGQVETIIMGKTAQGKRNRHLIPALHNHVRQIKVGTLSRCCGNAERVVIAYAKTGDLPKSLVMTENGRAAIRAMGPIAIFAWFSDMERQNERDRMNTIFAFVAAEAVCREIASVPMYEKLYGKTPEEWARLIKTIAKETVNGIEGIYVKMKEAKARQKEKRIANY